MHFAWIEEIRRSKEGLELLRDWLGHDAKPVDREEAERRATICACCPLNSSEGWWDKIKDYVAQIIRKQLEIKNKIGLRTSVDDDLHLCEACKCNTRLKVWAPMEHIARHTDIATYQKFALHCWVRHGLDVTWKKKSHE